MYYCKGKRPHDSKTPDSSAWVSLANEISTQSEREEREREQRSVCVLNYSLETASERRRLACALPTGLGLQVRLLLVTGGGTFRDRNSPKGKENADIYF